MSDHERQPARSIAFTPGINRDASVEEMPALRNAILNSCAEVMYQTVVNIPAGHTVQSLPILPYRQGPGNTCVLACNLAIRDSLLAQQPALPLGKYDEQELVQLAAQAGIYDGTGTDVGAGHRTADFIVQHLGLDITFDTSSTFVQTAEQLALNAINGNTSILTYNLGEHHEAIAHAVVVSGLMKDEAGIVSWIVMDPLLGKVEYTAEEMSDKVVNRVYIPHARGVSRSQLFTVNLPQMRPGFREISKHLPIQSSPRPTDRQSTVVPSQSPNQPREKLRPIKFRKKLRPIKLTKHY